MTPCIAMPARDAEGFLIDPEDWSEAVAEAIAAELGITLGEDHWDVIRFMRERYEESRVAVDARHVFRHLESRYPDGRKRLFELFPYGYVGQACKVAGMKRPRAWSTG